MTDHPATKGGTLIRIKMMMAKFATSDSTDRVDEIGTIEIFEPVLIRVVGVGTAIELVRRRILPTLFVTCIL